MVISKMAAYYGQEQKYSKSNRMKPMISQLPVVQLSSRLIFCQPKLKIFNSAPVPFCPKPSRFAAILKNCLFRQALLIHNIKLLISQLPVVQLSSRLIFCQPKIKIFNSAPVPFCPKPNHFYSFSMSLRIRVTRMNFIISLSFVHYKSQN